SARSSGTLRVKASSRRPLLRAGVYASPRAVVVGRHSRTLAQPSALFLDRFQLLLAFPVVELRPRTAEHDPFIRHAVCADLARIEVLDDLRRDLCREHEHTNRGVASVPDLMRSRLPPREADAVSLVKLAPPFGRAEGGLAANDEEPLLIGVMCVIRPDLVARLCVVQSCADQFTADVLTDLRCPEVPALPFVRVIQLVVVEVEDLHPARPPVVWGTCGARPSGLAE